MVSSVVVHVKMIKLHIHLWGETDDDDDAAAADAVVQASY